MEDIRQTRNCAHKQWRMTYETECWMMTCEAECEMCDGGFGAVVWHEVCAQFIRRSCVLSSGLYFLWVDFSLRRLSNTSFLPFILTISFVEMCRIVC